MISSVMPRSTSTRAPAARAAWVASVCVMAYVTGWITTSAARMAAATTAGGSLPCMFRGSIVTSTGSAPTSCTAATRWSPIGIVRLSATMQTCSPRRTRAATSTIRRALSSTEMRSAVSTAFHLLRLGLRCNPEVLRERAQHFMSGRGDHYHVLKRKVADLAVGLVGEDRLYRQHHVFLHDGLAVIGDGRGLVHVEADPVADPFNRRVRREAPLLDHRGAGVEDLLQGNARADDVHAGLLRGEFAVEEAALLSARLTDACHAHEVGPVVLVRGAGVDDDEIAAAPGVVERFHVDHPVFQPPRAHHDESGPVVARAHLPEHDPC